MRFRPNRRASTDQAPGPSIASAAPSVPSRICIHGSWECDKARDNSATASTTPANGVQTPTNNIAEAHAATNWAATTGRAAVMSPAMPC